MSNTFRWILFGLLVAVNAVSSAVLDGDTWYQATISILAGLAAAALVVDYFVRVRRR